MDLCHSANAPIKWKRKPKSGLQLGSVEETSKPCLEELADCEERLAGCQERFLANLNESALHSTLATACQALMAVPSANRPVTRAALVTFIRKRTKTFKAFVVDPVDVVHLLLAHNVFHPSGRDQVDLLGNWDVKAKQYGAALILLLSSCRPCLETRLPLSEWSRAHMTVERARAVELHKMSFRAAARWILSQAFMSIDVPAAHLVTTMCEVGALQIGDEQSGKLTYLNLNEQVCSRTISCFGMLSLPDDIHYDHMKVVNQRKQGAKAHHKFQRLAYLKKTFGKGIRGEFFGKPRRRRKKGVRKVLEVFSALHSQEPKNASARINNMNAASAVFIRRTQQKLRWHDRALRIQARDDKYNTGVDSLEDCAWPRIFKEASENNFQAWSSEWLTKWAVEEDLEHWHTHAIKARRRRIIDTINA